MKHSEAEVRAWMERQRRLHAAGRLPANTVKRLEPIPGWEWVETEAEIAADIMSRITELESAKFSSPFSLDFA